MVKIFYTKITKGTTTKKKASTTANKLFSMLNIASVFCLILHKIDYSLGLLTREKNTFSSAAILYSIMYFQALLEVLSYPNLTEFRSSNILTT